MSSHLGQEIGVLRRWLREFPALIANFPENFEPRRPGLLTIVWGLIAAVSAVTGAIYFGLAVEARGLLERAYPGLPLEWASYFPIGYIYALSMVPPLVGAVGFYVSASIWWARGKGARARTRPFERFAANAGLVVWVLLTGLGVIALVILALDNGDPLLGIVAFFGAMFVFIGGVMGGWPTRDLRPLLLTKRVMNWQLALSTAVVAGALSKIIGQPEPASELLGERWVLLFTVCALWLIAAGSGTVMYEPWKYRLEGDAERSRAAVRSRKVEQLRSAPRWARRGASSRSDQSRGG